VARQWCFHLYIRERALENFLSLDVKRNDVVRLPKFPTERCRPPRPPPPLRPPRRPPGVPDRPPRAPRRRPQGPRPFSPWIAVVFRYGAAPSPVDRRRAVVRGCPTDRRPPPLASPPLFPTRMTSSSPRAASPTTSQEPPPTAPPPLTAPSPPPQTAPSPPLATDTSSPPRSPRIEAGDGAGGVATTAPARWVFFSNCNYMC
jgi:hypothetical protein